MRKEEIICDKCNKTIDEEYSSYPFNVRYWECTPIYSKPSGIVYAVYKEPTPEKIYCTECFNSSNENNIQSS